MDIVEGNNGSNSVFSTITSAGGGFGVGGWMPSPTGSMEMMVVLEDQVVEVEQILNLVDQEMLLVEPQGKYRSSTRCWHKALTGGAGGSAFDINGGGGGGAGSFIADGVQDQRMEMVEQEQQQILQVGQ